MIDFKCDYSSNGPMNTNNKNLMKYVNIALIITLISMALHAYLANSYFDLRLGLSESKSLCNINQTFNCDVVSASRYAQFAGIPMAIWGLATHLILLVLLLISRLSLSQSNSANLRLSFYVSLYIAGVSVVMGSISSFYIGSLCLFCIGAYLLSFINLIFIYLAQESSPWNLPSSFKELWQKSRFSLWILIIGVPLVAFLGNRMFMDAKGYKSMDILINDGLNEWHASKQHEFSALLGLKMGPDNAVLTITEFADFGCPHCRFAGPTLEAFTKSHPDVQLIFKVFPLDGVCNSKIQHQGDGLRCQAAAAVFCSEELSQKGWSAHQWVFERQESLFGSSGGAEVLKNLAADLDIDQNALNDCMQSTDTTQKIRSMAEEGALANIPGTPAIFANGRTLKYGQTLPMLQAIYDEIKKK